MLTEALLLQQNRQLREENDELRETVRQLLDVRAEDAPLPAGIPALSKSEEAVIRLLLSQRSVVSEAKIAFALYGDGTRSEPIVRQWIIRLRRKLVGTPLVIKNLRGSGYYIDRTPAFRSRSAMHPQLVAAGQ